MEEKKEVKIEPIKPSKPEPDIALSTIIVKPGAVLPTEMYKNKDGSIDKVKLIKVMDALNADRIMFPGAYHENRKLAAWKQLAQCFTELGLEVPQLKK